MIQNNDLANKVTLVTSYHPSVRKAVGRAIARVPVPAHLGLSAQAGWRNGGTSVLTLTLSKLWSMKTGSAFPIACVHVSDLTAVRSCFRKFRAKYKEVCFFLRLTWTRAHYPPPTTGHVGNLRQHVRVRCIKHGCDERIGLAVRGWGKSHLGGYQL